MAWSADRVILRTICIVGTIAGTVLISLALATGDPSVWFRSSLAFAAAGYAWWRMRMDRSSAPVFLLGVVVIVAAVVAQQTVAAFSNGMLGLVALAFAASLLLDDRRLVFATSLVAVGVVTIVRSATIEEPVTDLIMSGAIPLVIILFGSQLMEWAKTEIRGRDHRYEMLFDLSPVAMWEEDVTEVAEWLDELRAAGVVDLETYFDEHPSEVILGASLIRIGGLNQQARRFLGGSPEGAPADRLERRLIDAENLDAARQRLLAVWEGRGRIHIRLTGASAGGQAPEGYLLMAASESGGTIDWNRVIVAMVDDSEQRAAQRALEELVDSKDRFIAAVSHELRTPLTAVIGLADELRSGVDDVPIAEQRELLDLISDQAVEVGDLVEDLLIAAQANIGRVTIVPEPVDLRREVERIASTVEGAGPLVDAPAPVGAIADPRRLRQVLRNLLSNARRYGGHHVTVHARQDGSSAVVEVRDDGEGIPAALTSRIFEPYETAHGATSVTGSVGLGLTVSRELARLMGGDLTYRRIDDHTVFRLVLPGADIDANRLVS